MLSILSQTGNNTNSQEQQSFPVNCSKLDNKIETIKNIEVSAVYKIAKTTYVSEKNTQNKCMLYDFIVWNLLDTSLWGKGQEGPASWDGTDVCSRYIGGYSDVDKLKG